MGIPVRVLIVEDAQDDAELMLRELRRGGFEPFCRRVETPQAMDAALAKETWDVILADYFLPHFSAPAALALVQQTGLDLPFIIVSGTIGEEAAVAAMKAGAHDYVMKGSLARLAPAVHRELQEAAARRARRRQAEQALRRSEAHLRAVMENVSDGVIILNGSGVIEKPAVSDRPMSMPTSGSETSSWKRGGKMRFGPFSSALLHLLLEVI